jgi:outer membrane protein OmpA-like peptidoglycan-associated protein
MRNRALFTIIAGLLSLGGQAAVADPAYKASDIIQHFAPKPGLGQTRGLCIGTEGECNGAATAAKPARPLDAFDLVVTFDYNSDALTKEARENLNEFSKALKDPQLATSSFLVEGHTDAKGPESYNLTLSERRANAVVRYLAEKGVTANLEPRGLGKTRPRTADPFEAANRRVETRLRAQ